MGKKQPRYPRRARGTGKIQRQPDGTFIARTTGHERSGRFPDRSSAEKALDTWNRQIGRGSDPNATRMPFRDFIRSWLADVVKPAKRPSTLEFYTRHAGYATAIMGDVALEAVGTQAIELCLSRLSADLSPRSVDHVRSVLHNAFEVARRWYGLPNPVNDIPHRRIPQQPERALTPAQVAILVAAIEDDRLGALYYVALILGLRRGELLGLRWPDVDWTNATIAITQQVAEIEGRKVAIVPYVKTDEGLRVLPLPPDLLARLRRRQEQDTAEARITQQRAAEKAQQAGKPIPLIQWNPDDLVFCSDVGTLIMPSNLNRRMTALVRRVNAQTRERATMENWPRETLQALLLPPISPHDLRHTALTDLAAVGEAKAVQSIAGHADIETTMNLYAGRRMGAMRAAVEAVEKARKTG